MSFVLESNVSAPKKELPPLRVLVVEDEPDTASSTAILLGLWGHDARIAEDGEAALVAVKEDCPDVVLLDMGLPGIGGWQIVSALKDCSEAKKPLVIAITGHAGATARKRSQEAGVDLHLAKPVEPETLRDVLGRLRTVIGG